jgi:PAT family beta-lactamase induction signal transducer AmpG
VWLLVLATSLDTMIGGMGQAAFVAFLMTLCSADYSATQFALLSALATLPRVLSGAAAGVLVPVVGWARFFVITCLAAIPGLILLVFMRRSVNELASRDTARSAAA